MSRSCRGAINSTRGAPRVAEYNLLLRVELRVESGVIVHFKLPVELEMARATPQLREQGGQATLQVERLLLQNGAFLAAPRPMRFAGGLPRRLNSHVIDFQ